MLPGLGREARRAAARGTGSGARPLLAARRLGRGVEAADAGRSPSSPPPFAGASGTPGQKCPEMVTGQARPTRDFRTVTRRQGGSAAGIQDRRAVATFSILAQRRDESPGLLCSLRGGLAWRGRRRRGPLAELPAPFCRSHGHSSANTPRDGARPGSAALGLQDPYSPPGRESRGNSGPTRRGCLL